MIYIILGTKAQLIKMAPVMRELDSQNITYRYYFTGQHKETVGSLSENFCIRKPDATLYEGSDVNSVFKFIPWIVVVLVRVWFRRKELFRTNDDKNLIVLHGDTLSTLLGAIIGRVFGIKVAHIESGLRSHNILHPFPEELTRILVFRLSSLFFCQDDRAFEEMKDKKGRAIHTQGNTIADSLTLALDSTKETSALPEQPYAIVSVHRFENIFFKKRLKKILRIVHEASKYAKIIFILHPPTEKRLKHYGLIDEAEAFVQFQQRLDFFSFNLLLRNASFIMTDGGSNQEESSYLGIPCLLLRNATERVEGVNINVVVSDLQLGAAIAFFNSVDQFRKKSDSHGKPSKIIVDELSQFVSTS